MKMKKSDLKQPNEVLFSNVLNALLSFGMGILPASQVINILINWSENFGIFSRKNWRVSSEIILHRNRLRTSWYMFHCQC